MVLIGASLLVLLLCVMRWQQLKHERLARAAQAAGHRQPSRSRQPTGRQVLAALSYPAEVALGEDEPSPKERWVAQVLKANPGMTPTAAARLYELWLADQDNPLTEN